jgi:phosphohistidine swiveling domain-containing protein
MTRELMLPLDRAVAESEVGGKASRLARLRQDGHRVPAGFVLTSEAFEQFLSYSDLLQAIRAASSKLDVRSALGVRCAAETIAALVRSAPIPDAIDTRLEEAWLTLGGPLIVRSSAIGEDSASASFAGQLDSIPGVVSLGLLRRAVLDVWASRWSARVLAYELARGVSLEGMGVIVQRQIESRISGVLFTRLSEASPHMLLEYCQGHGESLVAGHENPGRVTVSRSDFRWTHEARPESGAADERLLLNDATIAGLAGQALRIERSFGGPQDIEWTIDADGTLWFVQARPITAPAPHARSLRDADAVHWSNANVSENFPEPITPLLYSIAREGYYHYFRNLGRSFGISSTRLRRMEQPLRHIIGVHGARMYYNLSSIHGVLRSAPLGELLTSSFNLFVGADRTDTPAATRRIGWRTIGEAVEVLTVALKTTWQYLFVSRRVHRFERRVDAFAHRTHPDELSTRPAQALLGDFRGFLEIRNNRWNDAALADAAAMVSYGLLQRLLVSAAPDADQPSLHNNLLKALPGLVSSHPAIELWKLSRPVKSHPRLRALFSSTPPADVLAAIDADEELIEFKTSFRRYVEDWGFRCSGELMLTTPSFQERPAELIGLIAAYAALDHESPIALLERQAAERIAETRRVRRLLRRRPFMRLALSVVLRWTQKAILLRERARLKQALLYSRLRRIALAIGNELATAGTFEQPDDVFFVTAGELDELLSGSAMFPHAVRPLIAVRRDAHRQLSVTAPPDTLTLAPGEYFVPIARTPAPSAERPAPGAGARTLRGVGACGGATTAPAAVLEGVSDSPRLSPGDVLVTRQTDPGWAPLFPLISALVIERGGMLSHGAIIAREFGIPSVVGVKNATTLIAHGSQVHVNGDRGTVSLVEA